MLLIIAVVLEANPFLAGASLTSRHNASSSHSPGILVALDINWGSISSIQCADGDAGAVASIFYCWSLFQLAILRALSFLLHSCSHYPSAALCRDIRRLMTSLQ